MSNQILSQEEVDALLGAVATGEVDLEGDGGEEGAAKSFDLTSKSAVSNREFSVLQEIFDRYTGQLKRSLSTFLQSEISITLATTEIVKFEEYMRAFSRPTSFNFFTMSPLAGSAMMVIEPMLVSSLIDCMMGGSGKSAGRIREFTRIENRLIEKFVIGVLKDFEQSWETVYPLSISFVKTESNPDFIRLFRPSDIVMTVDFTLKTEDFEGHFFLCISYLMLEPIKDKLSTTYLREKDLDPRVSRQIKCLVEDVEVGVVAELGKARITIGEVLQLNVNDILRLHAGPADPVIINVGNIPKYLGSAGVIKGSKAVEIISSIGQKGRE